MSLRNNLYRGRERTLALKADHLNRAIRRMTMAQLNSFYKGKLATKSSFILRSLSIVDSCNEDLKKIQARIDVFNSLDLLDGGKRFGDACPIGNLRLIS